MLYKLLIVLAISLTSPAVASQKRVLPHLKGSFVCHALRNRSRPYKAWFYIDTKKLSELFLAMNMRTKSLSLQAYQVDEEYIVFSGTTGRNDPNGTRLNFHRKFLTATATVNGGKDIFELVCEPGEIDIRERKI